jgi:hypothetical protein
MNAHTTIAIVSSTIPAIANEIRGAVYGEIDRVTAREMARQFRNYGRDIIVTDIFGIDYMVTAA